jgi:hypothetical protein
MRLFSATLIGVVVLFSGFNTGHNNDPKTTNQLCGKSCPKSGCPSSCSNERGHGGRHICFLGHTW